MWTAVSGVEVGYKAAWRCNSNSFNRVSALSFTNWIPLSARIRSELSLTCSFGEHWCAEAPSKDLLAWDNIFQLCLQGSWGGRPSCFKNIHHQTSKFVLKFKSQKDHKVCFDFFLICQLSWCFALNDTNIRWSFVSAISRSNVSVIRNKLNVTSLKAGQIQNSAFFPDLPLHLISLWLYTQSKRLFLLHTLDKSLCGGSLSLCIAFSWTCNLFILMNLSFITCCTVSSFPAAPYNTLWYGYIYLLYIETTDEIAHSVGETRREEDAGEANW